MASRYLLLNDFATPMQSAVVPGYVSYTSACVVAIWPFVNPVTYSRTGGPDHGGGSGSNTAADALNINQVIILDAEIETCTVQNSKQNYVGNASIQLLPGALNSQGKPRNFMYETNPGDWMMIWMVNNEEARLNLRRLIATNQPCNAFMSGLKFIGRVSSVRQSMTQNPNSGERSVSTVIQGVCFRELDAFVYYDPLLTKSYPTLTAFYADLGTTINKFVQKAAAAGGISPIPALKFWIDLILGSGLANTALSNFEHALGKGAQQLIAPTGGTTSESAPYGYCVPQIIGTVLGQSSNNGSGVISYGSILDTVFGVQTYTDITSTIPEEPLTVTQPTNWGLAFNPNLKGAVDNRFETTGGNLLGQFLPEMPQFSAIPLWTHLMSYINPAVNEMYAAIRPDQQGNIQPTLIVRQYPFSSQILANQTLSGTKYQVKNDTLVATGAPQTYAVTPFLSLPRWVVDPTIVQSHDLGKTDGVRYNWVQIQGDLQLNVSEFWDAQSRVKNPPRLDILDIGRNGLRLFPVQKVRCSLADYLTSMPGVWQRLVADFAQGMSETISGTIQLYGIQAPIAVGDNLEYYNNVYHIEGISHHWSISSDGIRDFMTSITVSTGMVDNPQINTSKNFPDLGLYIPSNPDCLTEDDPGFTVQNSDPPLPPTSGSTNAENNSTTTSELPTSPAPLGNPFQS